MKIFGGKIPSVRNNCFWALAFACAAGFYWICRDAYYVGFFNDDAFYVIGARSLAQGRYVELNQPGLPPLINYMPGYSFLLMPLAYFFPVSTLPFQILSIFFALGGFVFMKLYAEDLVSGALLKALMLVVLFNPLTVSMSATVLSDVPFFFISSVCFFVVRKIWLSKYWLSWLLLASLAAMVYYIRPVGISMGMAIACSLLIERRWRECLRFFFFWIIIIVPFALPHFLRYGAELISPYRNSVGGAPIFHWIVDNGTFYINELFVRNLFRWPWPGETLRILTMIFCLIVVGIGIRDYGVRGWRKSLLLYLGIYLIVHLVWSKQAGRYIYPVFPLSMLFFFNGFDRFFENKKSKTIATSLLTALILAVYSIPLWAITSSSFHKNTPMSRKMDKTIHWVVQNTTANTFFATEYDGKFFLLTGRQVFHLQKIFDERQFFQWARDRHIDYILVENQFFGMRTHEGDSIHDSYPLGHLSKLLGNKNFYAKVFESSDEGTVIFRLNQNKPNP